MHRKVVEHELKICVSICLCSVKVVYWAVAFGRGERGLCLGPRAWCSTNNMWNALLRM